MNGRLSTNARNILRKMEQRKDAVVRELTREAGTIAAVLGGDAKRILQDEIYNVPIPLKASADRHTDLSKVPVHLRPFVLARRQFRNPLAVDSALRRQTTKGRAGKWRRTGNLKRMETAKAEGPHVVLRNNARYSLARNNLGTSAGRKIRSPGVKSVQWQKQAVENRREWILERRRAAVLRGLQV